MTSWITETKLHTTTTDKLMFLQTYRFGDHFCHLSLAWIIHSKCWHYCQHNYYWYWVFWYWLLSIYIDGAVLLLTHSFPHKRNEKLLVCSHFLNSGSPAWIRIFFPDRNDRILWELKLVTAEMDNWNCVAPIPTFLTLYF